MSRAVRFSVSYNNAKRTIPVREKHSFVCQLLGYVFRTVRPSVSYNDAKRQFPFVKTKTFTIIGQNNETNQSNTLKNKLVLRERVHQRRKSRSGVRSSMVHTKKKENRRREAIGSTDDVKVSPNEKQHWP